MCRCRNCIYDDHNIITAHYHYDNDPENSYSPDNHLYCYYRRIRDFVSNCGPCKIYRGPIPTDNIFYNFVGNNVHME